MKRTENVNTPVFKQIVNTIPELLEMSLTNNFYIPTIQIIKELRKKINEKDRLVRMQKTIEKTGIPENDIFFMKDLLRYIKIYLFDHFSHIIVMKRTYYAYESFFTEYQEVATRQLSDDFKNYLVHYPVHFISESKNNYPEYTYEEIEIAKNQMNIKFLDLLAERFVEK